MKSGYGEYNFNPLSSAARYEGEFVNDTQEGRGILYWKDGCQYNGSFANGLLNGHGILIIPRTKNDTLVYKYEGKKSVIQVRKIRKQSLFLNLLK